MPETLWTDADGNSFHFLEFQSKRFPSLRSNMEEILANLPNLPARHDDVMLLAYPKSGTNWLWEIANMLLTGKGEVEHQNRTKGESMIEAQPADSVDKLPSVRLLNTHVTPELYPTDLVKKKAKIVYILRNPKDVFVSFFHHAVRYKLAGYHGTWDGFFNLVLNGQFNYGSWFEYIHAWDNLFKEHPDVPVLTLYYEDMKKDLSGGVEKLAQFLEVPCDSALLKTIVEKCTFANLKKARAKLPEQTQEFVKGEGNFLFRKGIIGDWKNHFTVAQNERFDVEYKKKIRGLSFDFEQYMQ